MGEAEVNPVYEPLHIRPQTDGKKEQSDYSYSHKTSKPAGNNTRQDGTSTKRDSKSSSSKETKTSDGRWKWRRFFYQPFHQGRDQPIKHGYRGRDLMSYRPAIIYVPTEFAIRGKEYRNSTNLNKRYFQNKPLDWNRVLDKRKPKLSTWSANHDEIYSYFNPNNRIRLLRHDAHNTTSHINRSSILSSGIPSGKYVVPVKGTAVAQRSLARPPPTIPLPLRVVRRHQQQVVNGSVSAMHTRVPIVRLGARPQSSPPRPPISIGSRYLQKEIFRSLPHHEMRPPISRPNKQEDTRESEKSGDNDKPRAKYNHVTLSIPAFLVENELVRETETLALSCDLFGDASGIEVSEFAKV